MRGNFDFNKHFFGTHSLFSESVILIMFAEVIFKFKVQKILLFSLLSDVSVDIFGFFDAFHSGQVNGLRCATPDHAQHLVQDPSDVTDGDGPLELVGDLPVDF